MPSIAGHGDFTRLIPVGPAEEAPLLNKQRLEGRPTCPPAFPEPGHDRPARLQVPCSPQDPALPGWASACWHPKREGRAQLPTKVGTETELEQVPQPQLLLSACSLFIKRGWGFSFPI